MNQMNTAPPPSSTPATIANTSFQDFIQTPNKTGRELVDAPVCHPGIPLPVRLPIPVTRLTIYGFTRPYLIASYFQPSPSTSAVATGSVTKYASAKRSTIRSPFVIRSGVCGARLS